MSAGTCCGSGPRSAAPARARPVQQPRLLAARPPAPRRARSATRGPRAMDVVPALALMLVESSGSSRDVATLDALEPHDSAFHRSSGGDREPPTPRLQQEYAQVRIAAAHSLGMKQETPAQVTVLRAPAPTR